MNLVPYTYNGTSITTYGTRLVKGPFANKADVIDISRVSTSPAYGGKSFNPEEFDLVFNLTVASRQSDIEAIASLFDTRDISLRTLVARDANDSNTQYYIECTPTRYAKIEGSVMTVRMWAADPVWKKVTASTDSIAVAGSGTTTDTITNNGKLDAYPTITLTPSATGGWYLYRWHSIIYNPNAYALHNYPVAINGAGWDSATEVSAGRLQADGDDVAVTVNGPFVQRWLGGINTASTNVWVVLDFAPRIQATLKTALADSGETYIVFQNTPANRTAIQKLPATGLVLIDNECIAYTAKNISARRLTIDSDGRGAKNTTAATHSVGATIRWIQYDIVMLTGNAAGTLTTVDTDPRQPCFSLANSSNTEWRYDSADSVFGEPTGLRAGGWKPSVPKGQYATFEYTGNHGVDADPYTEMGAEIGPYEASARWKSEYGQVFWTLRNLAGIDSISAIGEHYRYTPDPLPAGTGWPRSRLWSSIDGKTWTQEYLLALPAAGSWASWTKASESVATNTRFLRFEFRGATYAAEDVVSRFEVNLGTSGSTAVALKSAGVPQVAFKTRESNAELNFILTNTTTGEGIEYSYPLAVGKGLVINTSNRTVRYRGKMLTPPEYVSETQQEWFRLRPGANTITYVDDAAGALSVAFSWNERKNA